jgi:hypothetical protein
MWTPYSVDHDVITASIVDVTQVQGVVAAHDEFLWNLPGIKHIEVCALLQAWLSHCSIASRMGHRRAQISASRDFFVQEETFMSPAARTPSKKSALLTSTP